MSGFLDPLFRTVLEHIDQAVCVEDRLHRIIYWNRAAELATGWAASEIIGRSCQGSVMRHLAAPAGGVCFGGGELDPGLTEKASHQLRILVEHKSGEQQVALARVIPIRDESGAQVATAELFTIESNSTDELEMYREARRLAFEDSLTGLPNRRGLDKELEALLRSDSSPPSGIGERRSQGRHGRFSALLLDLDEFKRVNDRYGHLAGDDALRCVAQTLAAHLRPQDVVGRWGGEEFLVLFPNLPPASLPSVSERLRLLVKRANFLVDGQISRSVTVSGGATVARADDTLVTILERADRLLYLSKEAGRDRISHDVEALPEPRRSLLRYSRGGGEAEWTLGVEESLP